MKLDLVIAEESESTDEASSDDSAAKEVLCLRILSPKTRFRFGGLEISVKSPAFEVGKTFTVSLDEHNRLAGIDSYKELQPYSSDDLSPFSSRSATPCPSRPSSRRVSLISSLGLKPARIMVNPSIESDDNEGLPLLSARLVLEEDPDSGVERGSSRRERNKKKKKHTPNSSRDISPSPQADSRRQQRESPTSRSPSSPYYGRTVSPQIIRRLMGESESLDASSSESAGKQLVSVGVGTTSNPRDSLTFALEGSLRRCRSWRR